MPKVEFGNFTNKSPEIELGDIVIIQASKEYFCLVSDAGDRKLSLVTIDEGARYTDKIFDSGTSLKDIENSLAYLSKISIIKHGSYKLSLEW